MAQTTELQQGLNEVVMNKVQRMIDGKAVGVRATMERLVNEGKIAQDYIAPIGVNLKINDHNPVITFSANGSLRMDMPDGQFTLHDNAIGQLADRMGIPQRYLRGLASGEPWAKQLAATLLNEHSGWTQRSRVLVRTVGKQVLKRYYRHRLPYRQPRTATWLSSPGQGSALRTMATVPLICGLSS